MDSHHQPGGDDQSASRTERHQMIAETNAFLTWALRHRHEMPRIPRRRVREGGFGPLLKRPGARAAVEHWWHRVLDELGA